MSTRPQLFRRQTLRLRITLAFVVTGVILAMILSLATFFTVRSLLTDQRVRSSTRQTVFGLLFAREFLAIGSGDAEELVSLLQARAGFQAIVTARTDFFSTSLSLTPAEVPEGLRALVASEQVGYQFTEMDRERVLAYGAPLPPKDTDLYLIYSLDDIDQTMSVLLRALLVAGVAVVAVAAILAQRVGGRIIRPLAEVSDAARRVAEGLLETRVASASPDELGLLAASFNQMASAFQEMLDRERRFVANTSHELRTPIATLRTASELLARHRDRLEPAQQEAVDLIVEDVANLRNLVEELMEVSEVDAGRARMRWEGVDLRSLAGAIVQRSRRDTPIEGEARTFADKVRLERIVSNLLSNAYDHGRGAAVKISIAETDGWCTLSVIDHGPGIAPDDLPLLFDRFYKADISRARDRGGVGLGLAIAQGNANLMGGRIEVTSAPGDGTRFTLRLPKRDTEPVESA